MGIAFKLRQKFMETGMTQRFIVKKINLLFPEVLMDEHKLSLILHGRRKLSSDELLAICKTLELNPDSLLLRGGDNDEK